MTCRKSSFKKPINCLNFQIHEYSDWINIKGMQDFLNILCIAHFDDTLKFKVVKFINQANIIFLKFFEIWLVRESLHISNLCILISVRYTHLLLLEDWLQGQHLCPFSAMPESFPLDEWSEVILFTCAALGDLPSCLRDGCRAQDTSWR